MSVWFRHVAGLDTDSMRDIADEANVEWSAESIVYRGHGIGFADGDSTDVKALQDAGEKILGYPPATIDQPPESDGQP